MDYEKKYKEALEKARPFSEHPLQEDSSNIVEYIFPELKKSEDERIRKWIIDDIRYNMNNEPLNNSEYKKNAEKAIAWLEKQGSQNFANSAKTCKNEQKPADLKTKAGNWYVCDMEVMNENMVTAFHRDEIYYCPKDGYLDVGGALFKVGCLDVFRLATEKEIPQPKQGEKKPLGFNIGDEITVNGQICKVVAVEQKPAEWSEEDEKVLGCAIDIIEWYSVVDKSKSRHVSDWLKSLKDRVQPQPALNEEKSNQKQDVSIQINPSEYINDMGGNGCYLKNTTQNYDLSEEDESMLQNILECLKNGWRKLPTDILKYESWLKSLRPHSQWKPSDEMLEALYRVIPENVMEISEDEILLDKLYQGLKYGKVLSNK